MYPFKEVKLKLVPLWITSCVTTNKRDGNSHQWHTSGLSDVVHGFALFRCWTRTRQQKFQMFEFSHGISVSCDSQLQHLYAKWNSSPTHLNVSELKASLGNEEMYLLWGYEQECLRLYFLPWMALLLEWLSNN